MSKAETGCSQRGRWEEKKGGGDCLFIFNRCKNTRIYDQSTQLNGRQEFFFFLRSSSLGRGSRSDRWQGSLQQQHTSLFGPRGSSNRVRLILYYPSGTAQFTAAFINLKDEVVKAQGICVGACFSQDWCKSVSPSPTTLTGQLSCYTAPLLVYTKS